MTPTEIQADRATCDAAPVEVEADISYGGYGDCAAPFVVKSCVAFYDVARTRWPLALDAIEERDREIERLKAERDAYRACLTPERVEALEGMRRGYLTRVGIAAINALIALAKETP